MSLYGNATQCIVSLCESITIKKNNKERFCIIAAAMIASSVSALSPAATAENSATNLDVYSDRMEVPGATPGSRVVRRREVRVLILLGAGEADY